MALKDLLEQKGTIVKEMRGMLDSNPGDKWNAECESRYQAQNAALTELQAKIDAAIADEETRKQRAKELDEIESRHSASRNDHRRIGGDGESTKEDRSAVALQAWLRAGEGQELSAEHRDACNRLGINPRAAEIGISLRGNYGAPAWSVQGTNSRRETRAGLDVGTSGAGQETIPQGFLAELDRKMLAYGGPRPVCRVLRTASGNALPIPKVDDTSNSGVLLAEATTIGTSVDSTFSAVTLNAYKYSSRAVLVSAEIIQDSAFNMAEIVASLLGERLGRISGAQFTTGTGSSQPEGIVVGSAAGKTAAATTAFTPDELIDLMHSVDPAYRMGATGWMMHDTTLLFIRKFKDSDGQYLWQPGLSAGAPDRILGFPVSINQHMSSTFTTGQKLVLFGDYSHFMIRDVAEIRFRRLDERYADTDQVGFVAFYRGDSAMIQSAAVKHLALA